MNRIYKVIWNEALGCFTAVGEYAKGRGKSSKSSVSSNTTINTTSNLSSFNTLRLSAIVLGLLAAGFGMQTNATGTENHHDGDYSHSHGSHGVHYHTTGNNSHNTNSNPNHSGDSISLKFEGDNATTITRSNGETLNILGGATGTLTNGNIGVFGIGDTLTIQLAENIDLSADGSLKMGDTLVDSSGITIRAHNPINNVVLSHSGLNNGNNVITGVAPGAINATSMDAVNGSQLNAINTTVAANKTKYYSVNSDVAGNANNDGATGQNAMAMGGNTTATGEQAIAIGSGKTGQHTTASGEQSIAIGANVVSKGHSSIALGGDDLNYASKANIGNHSASSVLNGGTVNTVFKDYAGKDMVEANQFDVNTESGGAASIAIGVKSQSKGDLSTAVGVHANSAGTASSAFGMGSSATGKGALALGAGAESNAQDGVALGASSVANVAGGATGFVPLGALSIDENAIIATRSVALGAVSIGTGTEGGNRQIVNLAAGTNDSDAVNVAQLKGLQNGVNNTLNQGMDFGGDSGTKVNRQLGDELLVKGGETDGTKLANGNNIGVMADGSDTLTIKLAKNLTGLDSLTTGDTVMNTGGVSFLGASTVRLSSTGLDNGGNQITNVASGGTTATNAANIGDVNRASNAARTQVVKGTNVASVDLSTDSLTGQDIYSINADGVTASAGSTAVTVTAGDKDTATNMTDYEVDLSGASKASLSKADSALQSMVTQIDGNDVKTLDKDNNTANFLTGDNIVLTAEDGGIKVATAENVSFTSVTTGNTLLNMGGVSFLGGSTVRLSRTGLDNGGNQITNVASGGTTATNAANIGDLNNAITGVSTLGFGLKAADGNTVQKSLGQTVELVGSNNNIDTRVNNGKIEVELNDNLDLGSTGSIKIGSSSPFGLGLVTTVNRLGLITGNGLGSTAVNGAGVFVNGPLGIPSTLLTTDGLTMLNGPSMTRSGGIDAGSKKITNVKAGVAVDDAVNVSQLNNATTAARTEVGAGTNISDVVKTSGSNGQDVYTINADGVTASAGSTAVTVTAGDKDTVTNTTDYAVDLSETSKASLVKADSAMQTVVTQIDGDTVKTLNKGDNTANFLTGDNIVLTAEDGGIKVATADDVVFTSVTTGNTLLNMGGVSFSGASTVRLSSTGLDNGGNQITNVADGDDDTDVVNVRQLKATNSTVDLGLGFTGDDTAVVVNRKLGQTLTIQGGAKDLTEDNIGVVADDEGNLNVRLAKDINLGRTGSVRTESTILNNAGLTITDGPNQTITLSNEGLDNGNNRIIKVAEGIAPSDAVNFAQLTTTNNEIAKGIKIGDGNSDNDQQFALGDTINVTGDSNLTTIASATGIQVKLNNQLNLGDVGSIQTGNSIMNSNGFTFIDNGFGTRVMLSSIGLDNGGNPIRNVGKGTLNTDAVNVEQLREVAIALDQGWGITAQGDIATMIKQGSSVDMNSTDGNIKVSRTVADNTAFTTNANAAVVPANGISFNLNPDISVVSVTTGDTTINDNGLTIVGGPSVTKNGIDAANTKITRVQQGDVTADSQEAINGSQLYAQGSGISSIIGGNTVYDPTNGTFTNSNIGGTGEDNIDGAIASIRQGTIAINENVQTNTANIANNTTNIATNTTNIATNVTNIKANKDRLDAGLNFGADSGANINKSVGDSSVLTFTGGNNITTTAEGSSIKFDLNGNINLDSVTTGNTTINDNGITMVGGPSMTASGINAAGNKITNVADGMAPRDAVNFGQLDAVSRRLGDSMNELGYKIGEVEDDANAGISAAMAMSSLPQAYIVGKSMIGGGVGTYNGESAVAIGFSKLSNDGRWVMKLNGTADTQGNAGASIGAGFHFD
ncbi:YadA-like family protein [Psychrobacter vallis]|uniref:YadA-like family protein n=1 Tax=Psychrobacter vallis TaxID=248451 RepID=UPI00191A914E|nr:YadA-like family protein [Psychrobacter vallis]